MSILNENGIENLKCGYCWTLHIIILNYISSIKTRPKILGFMLEMLKSQLIGFGDQEKEKMTSSSVVQSSNHATYKLTDERVAFWWCGSCGLHIWIAQWLNFFLENSYFFWFCTPSGGKLGPNLDQKRKLWVRPAVVKIKAFQKPSHGS